MKKIGIIICAVVALYSCQNELDIDPQGTLTEELLPLDPNITEDFLISAYAVLDGNLDDADVWRSAPSNWVYGEVASDNAYKGSEPGDQTPIDNIEAYTPNATSSFFEIKYRAVYDGISKSNASILRTQANIGLREEESNQLIAEARFLRGHYHFEAKKMWNKIVYVDENVTESDSLTNTTDDSVWDRIEEDFEFGATGDNMSVTSESGRANRWMAKTYLAKVHMYQGDFAAAKILLDEIILGGPYSLNARFSDNFNAEFNNSNESIFAIQYFVNEGIGNDSTGNWGDVLNFPNTGEAGGGCCGFYQPSQNLVNAFKTDVDGLPLLDTFNDVDVLNEEAQFNAYVAANGNDEGYDETFQIETGNLDPRLDRTVGRRGIDFQGWGIHPGRSWIRDMANAGPYLGKKTMHKADQEGSVSSTSAWSSNVNSINVNIIRFAEVLLWRAEIAASEGDLNTALDFVNRVRLRAANTDDFVTNEGSIEPAANYVIGQYDNFADQEEAIKAVEHEQRIELAMEGHRFFELVRKGTAVDVLNTYIQDESNTRSYLSGAVFSIDNEFYPFPQAIIDESQGVLKAN